MTIPAPAVCTEPVCARIVNTGLCDEHQAARKRTQARRRRRQGDTSMTHYTTPAWRRTRGRQLKNQPACAKCGDRATVVDHI
ncbi:MAG: hypothetical protein ACK5LJ_05820, partial [Paracoccus sp. (in: a-proteobacteria)]